jgi:hypothetical protein
MNDGEDLSSKNQVTSADTLDVFQGEHLGQSIVHVYEVECYGPDGILKWRDTFHNLVTTAGLNKYLDATLKSGSAAPTWYIGLITGPGAGNTYNQADTMAVHGGWVENQTYSDVTRRQWVPGAVAGGSVSNTASKAVFNINGNATIAGCFMVDNSTKGGGLGTLLGEGNFTGGDRLVQNQDTLNIAVTATQA